MKQSVSRSWKHLARERLKNTKPTIPLGPKFWPLSASEKSEIKTLFDGTALRHLAVSLRSRDDDAEVELDCNWSKNRNYLTRSFKISVDGDTSFSGMQLIGWDPTAKAIRSWTFDSNGTFAEATWQQKAGRWFLRNRGTLADGRSATMINVMKQVDADSFTWQTIERTAGGELLPNIDEIQIVRR